MHQSPDPAKASLWPRCQSLVPADPALEARVRERLAGMSLEQKVGQMIMAELQHVSPGDIHLHQLGAVLNGGGSTPGGVKHATVDDWAGQARSFHNASVQTDVDAVPIVWGTDAVHGHNNVVGATIFPHNIGLGAARNPDLIERIGEVTAAEVAATGIHWSFAPTLAVVRDDRWGRTYEAYSEDPELVAEYAPRMVYGLQGRPGSTGFLGADRVLASAKHFIGDGGTVDGIDQGDNLVSEAELALLHGAGHFAALAAGVQTVMVTFNSWRGEKVHGHQYLLTTVLKDQLGFDGIVVTDWNGFGQVDGCSNQSCARAINAGVDMLMAPEDWRALLGNTVAQVRSGEIAEARINDAVTRILRVKLRSGLVHPDFTAVRPLAGRSNLLGCAPHRAVARQAVRESLVLLKNKGQLLPLHPDQRVLVTGVGADDIGMQCGGWTLSWQGDDNHNSDFPGATSILDGLREAIRAGNGSVEHSTDGSFETRPDVAVVVYGEPPYAEGFGDRRDLSLSADRPDDLTLLRKLQAQGIPVVSVLLTGRPMWANPELNASDAFLVAWLPGSEGIGVADVLVADDQGKVRQDVVGRLSFSWPRDALQTCVNRNDNGDPLFAYGFGLGFGEPDPLVDQLPEHDSSVALHHDTRKQVLFRGKPMAPLGLFIGDSADWQVPVRGWHTESPTGAVVVTVVDGAVQGDSRRVQWPGHRGGQVYLHAGSRMDLTHLADRNAVLQIRLRVEAGPEGAVELRMDSNGSHQTGLDITERLRTCPQGQWLDLSFDLADFAARGVDFAEMDTPLLLWTEAPLTLAFGEVQVSVPAAEAPRPVADV